ncbi:hypothetical protein BB560_002875 [Smittium megazygosporum]|uniref:ubiquitinyl hydrolase 1 n=1 Tax=Smittium megazygosporum TaxID=133381 RepID=A0A2T9ZDQ1_9FUNG|nr:hypothetical protein BB560_002875 [Smittium megazygosporum]
MEDKPLYPEKPTVLNESEFISQNFHDSGLEIEDSGFHHWEIKNWDLLDPKCRSEPFKVGSHNWNILLYPQGNRLSDRISIYLEYSDSSSASEGWHSCAQFILAISNLEHPEVSFCNTAQHRFNSEESDWGFTTFIDFKNVVTPNAEGISYLQNNSIRISAFVQVVNDKTGVLWHNFVNWDSRKETGFVGLKNQGATCYMNSLLQTLYFTNSFRRSVYRIPTEEDNPKSSISLALQRVFYSLQESPNSVGTTELTSSFGWDPVQAFMQHDVQEFNRVLQDNLETKMKGTVSEGDIAAIFEGKMKSYVECVNVNYVSSRIENYYDISLNVKGCKNLHDSFVEYCQVEILDDLSPFLSKEADRSESWEYELHAVLVHSGDLHSGHYFVCVRPTTEDKWYKFDDDNVIPVSEKETFEENFGGEYLHSQTKSLENRLAIRGQNVISTRKTRLRSTSAYMLVYFRKSRLNDILQPITKDMIPKHLIQRVSEAKNEEERKVREKKEMHMFSNMVIITEDIFKKNQSFDIADIQDIIVSNVNSVHKVRKDLPLSEFSSKLSEMLKLDPSNMRLWSFFKRYNSSIRVDTPLADPLSNMTVENVQSILFGDEMYSVVYVEEVFEKLALNHFDYFNYSEKNSKIIHIKFYDPFTRTIEGVDKLFLNDDTIISDIIPYILKLKSLPEDAQVLLYEEVYPGTVNKLIPSSDVKTCQIVSGDIIVFQLDLTQSDLNKLQAQKESLIYVTDYFDHVKNTVKVTFCSMKDDGDLGMLDSDDTPTYNMVTDGGSQFELTLDITQPYLSVAEAVAAKIELSDPTKLQFFLASESGMPRIPVSYNTATRLSDMLSSYTDGITNNNQLAGRGKSNFIFFKILDVSLDQLDKFRKITVTLILKTMKETRSAEVLVAKTSDTQSLIESLYVKVSKVLASMSQKTQTGVNPSSSPPATGDRIERSSSEFDFSSPPPFGLRVYEVINNRILRIFKGHEPVSSITDYGSTIIAEVTPSCTDRPYDEADYAKDSAANQNRGSLDDTEMNCRDGKTEGRDMEDDAVEDSFKSIEVFNFDKDVSRSHGIPFELKVFPKESFYPGTWQRIKKKLGVSSKEFANIRPAFICTTAEGIQKVCYFKIAGSNSDAAPEIVKNDNNDEATTQTTNSGEDVVDSEPPPYSIVDEYTNAPSLEYMVSQESVCLYDLVNEQKCALGLDHIERHNRHRQHLNEGSIKILN